MAMAGLPDRDGSPAHGGHSLIIDLQRRIQEAGRIRIGQQVLTSTGKSRPTKLSTFRVTSSDRTRIEQIAERYGGTVEQWDSPTGPQWQVITDADTLPVIVPPSAMAFSQSYEAWAAGGCRRRCDGVTEQLTQGPCLCDPDNRECAIHSRLSVLLRDVPGIGVYRLDTQGYYAAVEMRGAVEVIQAAAGHGVMLPARLRLDQRTAKRDGPDGKPQTRHFAVPVLDIELTPAQLMGSAGIVASRPENGGGTEVLGALPAANGNHPGEPAHFTPVPADLPTGPRRSIAQQSAPPAPKPKRANAAPEIPHSGRQRRGANVDEQTRTLEANGDVRGLQQLWKQVNDPGSRDRIAAAAQRVKTAHADTEPSKRDETEGPITEKQSKRLHVLCTNGSINRDTKLALLTHLTGREVTTSADLTTTEAEMVNNTLSEMAKVRDIPLIEQVIELLGRPENGDPA